MSIHALADVRSENIGEGTRVWQYCVVLPMARIGANCNICAHVFIENDVVIGDNVTIKSGVQVWDGLRIESDVFIGPNATFSNDRFPRSKKYPERFAVTTIKRGATVGANATILPGIVVGERAMIGAGAVVTRSVPPNAIVVGNPATIVGYVDAVPSLAEDRSLANADPVKAVQSSVLVSEATVFQFPVITDIRGSLTVGEFERDIPFKPLRYFMVFGVPSRETRGEHAHKACHQFLVCVRGRCSVVTDDGSKRAEVTLDSPQKGVHVPPMIWSIQYKYSEDALLLVFASHHYDAGDYIRNYDEFLDLRRKSLPKTDRP